MKRILLSAALIILLCFLLFCPQAALFAARNGLLLWYRNLVPVLLPFMICSNMMIRLDCIRGLVGILHPLLHLIWGTSLYGSYAMFAGFLFGFPMGAKVLHDLMEQKRISSEEAFYLMGFVNNLSPAFLITYLVRENLQQPEFTGPTLAILYGAPALTGMITSLAFRQKSARLTANNKASKVPLKPELIDACISDGIFNITKLGGYILLFSLICALIQQLIPQDGLLRCLVCGLPEVTSGIRIICGSSLSFPQKYLCLTAVCSFGGICALMQTYSVCPMTKKQFFRYIMTRIAGTVLALLLAILFLSSMDIL